MTNQQHTQATQAPGNDAEGEHRPSHDAAITLDGIRREVAPGDYVVSALKARLGVPADYELDQVVNGEFRELVDAGHVDIKGGEHFVSHVRRGGSS